MIQVRAEGLVRFRANVQRLERKFQTFRKLFEKFGDEFYEAEKRTFASAPWVPLSAKYAAQKRKKYGGKPILRATDKLYSSFTRKGAEGNVNRIRINEAEFGSSVSYARFHQFGTGKMPARPPLALTDQDFQKFDSIAEKHLAEMIRESGFV